MFDDQKFGCMLMVGIFYFDLPIDHLFLGNEEDFHTKPSSREEEILVNDKESTQYKNIFTLEIQSGKPTFLKRFYLLLSYSFRIKSYVPNIGLHLRHNQHHTFLIYIRTTL
jgi:hypothetical protein